MCTDLQSHSEGVGLGAAVPHEVLDELKDVHRLLLHGAVGRHDHGLLDGLTAPGQHVGNGHLSSEETLKHKRGMERNKERVRDRKISSCL